MEPHYITITYVEASNSRSEYLSIVLTTFLQFMNNHKAFNKFRAMLNSPLQDCNISNHI